MRTSLSPAARIAFEPAATAWAQTPAGSAGQEMGGGKPLQPADALKPGHTRVIIATAGLEP